MGDCLLCCVLLLFSFVVLLLSFVVFFFPFVHLPFVEGSFLLHYPLFDYSSFSFLLLLRFPLYPLCVCCSFSQKRNTMQSHTGLAATQRALTLAILLLHSVEYILAILGSMIFFVFQDFVSSSNASYVTIFSSILVLSWRHEYRRVIKIHGGSSSFSSSSSRKMIENKKEEKGGKERESESKSESESESEREKEREENGRRPVRLLTYNIFCRPPLVRNNEDDYKNERLELFLQEIEQYDIIALQEIFELLNTRPKFLLRAARKKGFKYSLRGTWPSFGRKFIDPGVLLLSKHPIVQYDHHIFQNATEVDQFAAKQMMYAGISIEGKMVHVFTTHTQATYGNNEGGAPKTGNPLYEWGQKVIKGGKRDGGEVMKECDEARVGQLREAREFIDGVLKGGEVLGRNDIAVLMADLNVDALNSPEEYDILVDILSKSSGYHVSNAFFDAHGYHPVTYGDVCPNTGENLETTLTAPMDCGMKASLDYLIVFRKEKGGEGVGEGVGEGEEWGKGFDSPYRVEDVKVEPFFVREKQEKPITQLSDHYGVSAVLVPQID